MLKKKSLQEVHYAIEDFLNGYSLTKPSRFFYPFLDKNIFFGLKINSKEYSKNIENYYKKGELESKRKKILKEIEIKKNYNDWIKKIKDLKKIKFIQKIRKGLLKIQKDIYAVILIGSYSSYDFLDFSDCDIILILNKEVFTDAKKILKIRKKIIKLNKFLYLNDPFQHHGLFIFNESELENYYQDFMPVETIKEGIVLVGKNKIKLNIAEDKKLSKEKLLKIIDYLKKPKYLKETFFYKLYISNILLLPSYFLQNKGIYISKKQSFIKIKKFLGKEEMLQISKASEIRKKWTKKNFFRFLVFLPNFWIINYINKIFYFSNKNKKLETKQLLNKIENEI